MIDQPVTITPETLLAAATAAYYAKVSMDHDYEVNLLRDLLKRYLDMDTRIPLSYFDLPPVAGDVATITYRLRVLDGFGLKLCCYYTDPDSLGIEYDAKDEKGATIRIDSLASLGRAIQVLRHPPRRYAPTHAEQLVSALSVIITDMLDEAGAFNQ